jgi:hypothetical protein
MLLLRYGGNAKLPSDVPKIGRNKLFSAVAKMWGRTCIILYSY